MVDADRGALRTDRLTKVDWPTKALDEARLAKATRTEQRNFMVSLSVGDVLCCLEASRGLLRVGDFANRGDLRRPLDLGNGSLAAGLRRLT